MKILHNDENLLILRPKLRGSFITMLFGLLFLVMGLIFVFWQGTVNHLNCERDQREQVQCQFTKTTFGLRWKNIGIEELHGARLETSIDGDGGKIYRIILDSNNETYPLILVGRLVRK